MKNCNPTAFNSFYDGSVPACELQLHESRSFCRGPSLDAYVACIAAAPCAAFIDYVDAGSPCAAEARALRPSTQCDGG
jgi:hypothetical protein